MKSLDPSQESGSASLVYFAILMTILDIEGSRCSTFRLVGQFFYYQARYLNSETIFVRMSAPEMSEMVPGLLKKDSERLAGREIKTASGSWLTFFSRDLGWAELLLSAWEGVKIYTLNLETNQTIN